MLHLLSTLVVLIVAAGVALRRRPEIHVRLMATAFAIDLGIVLYIETTRHAVAQVTGPAGPLIWFHATVSVLVLAAYVGQITIGRRLLAGRATSRRLHIAIGIAFCLLRGTNYLTAFMVSNQTAAASQQAAQGATAPLVAPPFTHSQR